MFSQFDATLGLFGFEELAAIPHFTHAFTSRATDRTLRKKDITGVSEIAKRRPIFRSLDIPVERVAILQQVHSNRVACLADCIREPGGDLKARDSDAILLSDPGHFGVVRTADCLPVLALVPGARQICLLHAGWRGTRDHVVRRGVSILMEEACAKPAEVIVAFGPAIRKCCYRVGDELREEFRSAGYELKGLFEDGRLDLVEANRRELEGLGISSVLDSGECTCCRAEAFYSFRARCDEGRIWAIAGFQRSE